MTRKRLGALWMAACLMPASPGWGAPITVPLLPVTAQVGIVVYAMGLWPMVGQFGRFSGSLLVDTAAPGACAVALDVEVDSLRMADPTRTGLALGPHLLDARRYPGLHYAGTCTATASNGALTLHGVTHALTLATRHAGNVIQASGSIRRGDYGIDGLPGVIGRTVDMRVSVTLPKGVATRLYSD